VVEKDEQMEYLIFAALIAVFLTILIYTALNGRSPLSRPNVGKSSPAKPHATAYSGDGRLNIIVSSAQPPGAIFFGRDGTIAQVPDSLDARHKWVVEKMTLKIEKEPDDGEWYFERGKAYMALNQYAEAIADFNQLIAWYPTSETAYRMRGLCYFHAGDKVTALADLRQYRLLATERGNRVPCALSDELKTRLAELKKQHKEQLAQSAQEAEQVDKEVMEILKELEKEMS
jgi:hypothetical protein